MTEQRVLWQVGDWQVNIFTGKLLDIERQREASVRGKDRKVLRFLILKYGHEYSNDDIILEIWGEEGSNDSLYQSIVKLRRVLNGEGKEYIDKDPYRLAEEPKPIFAESRHTGKEQAVADVEFSDAEQPNESASVRKDDFTLIVDGMIINTAGELLHEDADTSHVRTICAASYERCMEDLAFASVYASRLVTSKGFRPSLTTPGQPGVDVRKRLGEICIERPYPSDISEGRLLRIPDIRNGIRADITRLARCVTDKRCIHFFRAYMVREAAKHLGEDISLFQEDFDPNNFKYNVARPYYQDRDLQSALGSTATNILAGFLPKSPLKSKDRFAKNALREFVTRNVLSLITIMWESDTFAQTTGAWRMPHILRALVLEQRHNDSAGIQHQKLVRHLVVQHALMTALQHMRKTNRDDLMSYLLNLRDDYPFKQIRQLLNSEHLIFIAPGAGREKAARRVLEEFKKFTDPGAVHADPVSLAHRSTLRTWGLAKAADYEHELYRVFPELRPEGPPS